MANHDSTTTGLLILDKVTPVINALFGCFNLDANYPGNGSAYIAKMSHDNNTRWEVVCVALATLCQELGLDLPDESEEDISTVLRLLSVHFKVDGDKFLAELIENPSMEANDEAELDELFQVALRFDDGHGLKAIQVEGAWVCSRPLLFEFGGHGIYIGRHFNVASYSNHWPHFGSLMEAALIAGDTGTSAALVKEELLHLVSGVVDDEARSVLIQNVARLVLVEPENPVRTALVERVILQCGDNVWGACKQYPISDWQHEVENRDTILGYWEWVISQAESDEVDLLTLTA